ncbi:MAG: hypothetical protein ACRDMV_18015 [Streptosporangiales bacterium]
MVKAMRKAQITATLSRKDRATKVNDDGDHETWRCTCGQSHRTYVPRHREIKTKTTNKIYKQMIDCPLFGKGWL